MVVFIVVLYHALIKNMCVLETPNLQFTCLHHHKVKMCKDWKIYTKFLAESGISLLIIFWVYYQFYLSIKALKSIK